MITGSIVPIELLSKDVIIMPRLTTKTTYRLECIVIIVNSARRINKRICLHFFLMKGSFAA
jgi:hypothetical protein